MKENHRSISVPLWATCILLAVAGLFLPFAANAQVDQGTIAGLVQDQSGAVVPKAKVTLTNIDTGLVLERNSNESGVYVFSPIKIGNYKVSATASGFQTTTRENVHLDAQQRLNIVLSLVPGAVTQTVTVTDAAPLLQTQTNAVGQVISAETINNTPLNGRNWVYIAQLTAGVAPPFGQTRGSGSGDFIANGQRAEQNNFILDGVDNNTNLVDFLNGSSYVMRPPPDALSEFSLQTSNFSAEFGHSAGGVMSASIKSGTNQIHGDVWEYVRNTSLDSNYWYSAPNTPVPPYHQNQFGGTLGFPILKNKLFYFGDIEANRISISAPSIQTVPTALMRQGNFSEILQGSLTGNGSQAITLYQPNSANVNAPLSCNGQANVLCPNQIDPVAQNILKLYPAPNANNGKTYNNLNEVLSNTDNIIQWDQRVDWNASSRDQFYARYSYLHEIKENGLTLGPVLDGNGYGGQSDTNLFMNFMGSETHVFGPTLTNEFRFGYNWGVSKFLQANAFNPNISPSLGLGGIPSLGPGKYGLPLGQISNLTSWGSVGTNDESQNTYQILDNVTELLGNHSLKFGVSLQAIRFAYQYAPASLGQYDWNGTYTGIPGTSFTGYGGADFLANQAASADVANAPNINDAQWYYAGYAQDDWKVTPKLTINLGIRYDYYQPYKENSGHQANFVVSSLGLGTGSAVYELPKKAQNVPIGANFINTLAANNVTIQYVDNQRLANAQKTNFAPRVGFAYQALPGTVVRSGLGIFYGGLMAEGNTNLGSNYPFFNQANFNPFSCVPGFCPSISTPSDGTDNSSIVAPPGITLETGIQPQIAAGGLLNFVSYPGFHSTDVNIKTPYTVSYSMSVEQALSNNIAATISYVGNFARHLSLYGSPNTAPALWRPGTPNTNSYNPFPTLGGIGQISYAGVSTYNSLQAKLEKRYSHGLSFLATYTWSHAMDDASDAGGNFGAIGDRNLALIPFIDEFTNSNFDVRSRFTINGNYELPFGRGREFLGNSSRWVDEAVGGWSSSLTYAAQTGTPFTAGPDISTAGGGGARAIVRRDPYAGGGEVADPTNTAIESCPAKVRTKANYFNPCALGNPVPGELISNATTPLGTVNSDGSVVSIPGPVRDTATAEKLLGGLQNTLYSPGYYQVNMSLFKTFKTWREQNLQFRADAFNILNHPTLGTPNGSINQNGGQITGAKTFQNNTPDSRFFQLSLKYAF
jgi:Carboxypeptidase regulatory-like domain/TonB-dependent Receptor Plug Domain